MRAGWQTKALEEACQFSNGLWKGEKPPFVNVGVIRNTNFTKEGALDDSDIAYLDVEAKKFEKRKLQFGDIILEKSGGGPKQPVGRVVLFDKTEGDFSFSNFTAALRVIDARELDFRFLHKFLYWTYVSGVTEGIQSNSTGIRNLDGDAYKAINISFPPLPEQQRIVGILDAAFDGIATAKATAEQNLQNARALFESHLQSVFTQLGEDWVEKRLGDICERVSVGHVGPTSEFYCNKEEGIPFLRSQNVRRGYLDWDGLQYVTKEFHKKLRKSQLRAGDLLFVRVGANRGDCCSVPNDLGEINCANIVFARPTEGNATYLQRYCDSTHGREQLLGMTTGSAQGVINTSSVAELIVPLPPPLEQKRIVDSLNEMQAETQRLESLYQRKLAALDELKKSLLHQAFSGAL